MNNTYSAILRKISLKNLVILFVFLLGKTFAQAPTITLTPVITNGLTGPIAFVNAGDGTNRVFIVQKSGTILAYDASFTLLSTFLTVTNISSDGERGLLSMAFHPNYATNGFFYVYYTTAGGMLEIARYQVSASPNVADANSKKVIISIPHPGNTNHNGGELHFGNDGYLYLSTGDGGGAGDVSNNAQNTSVLLGKILRFAVNTASAAPYYSVPAGNPYNNEIYDIGLRNPYRWSFDRQTHDMWIGDVGQDSWEEINFRPAGAIPGQNYGWRCYEGNAAFNTTGCGPQSSYVAPAHTYSTQNPAASITGGIVYRGSAFPALQGYYLSADFYSGAWYKIISDGAGGWTTTPQTLSPTGMVHFGETESGEAYVVSHTDNSVHRIGTNATGNPVGIAENKNRYPVAPKIAEGILYMNLDEKANYTLLEIVSMSGAVVAKETVTGKTGAQETSLQQLQPGIYLLRLSGTNSSYVHKLIIN
ncbi:glucose dehydrogenase [Sphingobacteriaceae bacterium]|nr:glucose dehydrogenase [Sphingobacteriaceae bacterium]